MIGTRAEGSRGDAPRRATEDAVPSRAGSSPGAALKRALDLVVGAALLVAAAPLVLAAMALVKLTSRGPAIYAQRRTGLDGRVYTLYKIRSMVHDCERRSGPRWSTPGDPRVTPVGRFLRRTHLDELPQLWNVVRGEMGLVGPRPERPEFIVQLEKAFPNYRDRLQVRPGLTGLAAILLPPDTDLESVRRKLSYDLYYVRRAGPWLDLRILAGTALHILGVPYAATRALLGLPGPGQVERHLAGQQDQDVEALAQVQTA